LAARAIRCCARVAPRVLVAVLLAGCAGFQTHELEQVDPLTRTTAQVLFDRGRAFARHGDHIRAEQYLTAAIERGLDSRLVIEPLMRVCIDSARYGTALRHGRDHLVRHPDDWSMRMLVASLLGAIDRPDEQQFELERVIAERPDEPAPYFALAQRLLADGESAGARVALRMYLRISPRGSHARTARRQLELANPAHEPDRRR
jgi:predicted Zn-dependent protease